MSDAQEPGEQAGEIGSWLRADPQRLIAALALALAVPLAVLLALGPPAEPEAPVPTFEALPDFAAIDDVRRKKQAFFDYLLPMVEAHNARVRAIREELRAVRTRIEGGGAPSSVQWDRIAALARRYRVELDPDTPLDLETVDRLLRRADLLPPSLVLAQAATESAWGTSRFARTANNLFGEWCFTEGCGIVPSRRAEGATHEVEEFDTVYDSVDSYFRNLNSHPAYRGVRERREAARKAGRAFRGAELAAGLTRYSERGDAYIEELRLIMRVNDLDDYDLGPAVSSTSSGP